MGTCGHAITEVHELLHAFGYPHSDDNNSIMYPSADTFSLVTQKEGACVGSDKEIDSAIVEDLFWKAGKLNFFVFSAFFPAKQAFWRKISIGDEFPAVAAANSPSFEGQSLSCLKYELSHAKV